MAEHLTFQKINGYVFNADQDNWAFLVQDGDTPVNPSGDELMEHPIFHKVNCYVFDDPDWVPLEQF